MNEYIGVSFALRSIGNVTTSGYNQVQATTQRAHGGELLLEVCCVSMFVLLN